MGQKVPPAEGFGRDAECFAFLSHDSAGMPNASHSSRRAA